VLRKIFDCVKLEETGQRKCHEELQNLNFRPSNSIVIRRRTMRLADHIIGRSYNSLGTKAR